MAVVIYLMLCIVPALVFALLGRALDSWSRWSGQPLLRFAARASRSRPPQRPDLSAQRERCTKDLRRLSADHDRLMAGSDLPARAFRLRAVQSAYDDTLRAACRVLEIDAPPAPLDAATRIQLEADLVTHGLTW